MPFNFQAVLPMNNNVYFGTLPYASGKECLYPTNSQRCVGTYRNLRYKKAPRSSAVLQVIIPILGRTSSTERLI